MCVCVCVVWGRQQVELEEAKVSVRSGSDPAHVEGGTPVLSVIIPPPSTQVPPPPSHSQCCVCVIDSLVSQSGFACSYSHRRMSLSL